MSPATTHFYNADNMKLNRIDLIPDHIKEHPESLIDIEQTNSRSGSANSGHIDIRNMLGQFAKFRFPFHLLFINIEAFYVGTGIPPNVTCCIEVKSQRSEFNRIVRN